MLTLVTVGWQTVRQRVRLIFLQDAIILWLMAFALLVVLGTVGVIAWVVAQGTATAVIHYTIYFGIDLLDSAWRLWLLPASALFIWLVNTIVVLAFGYRERFVAYSVTLTTVACMVLLAINSILLVWINR